mmetsp:Transcript_500/g.1162  ORF Transcript_500/g.1162 Transcript_500/m.1162 type:complete len:273 (-) Transcript_500:404-1222(-)
MRTHQNSDVLTNLTVYFTSSSIYNVATKHFLSTRLQKENLILLQNLHVGWWIRTGIPSCAVAVLLLLPVEAEGQQVVRNVQAKRVQVKLALETEVDRLLDQLNLPAWQNLTAEPHGPVVAHVGDLRREHGTDDGQDVGAVEGLREYGGGEGGGVNPPLREGAIEVDTLKDVLCRTLILDKLNTLILRDLADTSACYLGELSLDVLVGEDDLSVEELGVELPHFGSELPGVGEEEHTRGPAHVGLLEGGGIERRLGKETRVPAALEEVMVVLR